MAYTLIRVDEENHADEWWTALQECYPIIGDHLIDHDHAVVSLEVLAALQGLPGWHGGPAYAPTPLIDLGDQVELTDVVAARYRFFDEPC